MTNNIPPLEVHFDGSYLDYEQELMLVSTQFLYREPGLMGQWYADSFQLSKDQKQYTVESDQHGRPLTALYSYFYIYLFQQKLFPDKGGGILGFLSRILGVDELVKLFEKIPIMTEFNKLVGELPTQPYVSDFCLSNANNVVVERPCQTTDMSLFFFPDGEIDGEAVTATQAWIEISYLNAPKWVTDLFSQLADVQDYMVPMPYYLNAELTKQSIKVYSDDNYFSLRTVLHYDVIVKSTGESKSISEGPFNITPRLPAIFLKPGLTLYSIGCEPDQINWLGTISAPIQLVLVVLTLSEGIGEGADGLPETVTKRQLPPAIFSPIHQNPIYRTMGMKRGTTVTYDWLAYYYFSDGRIAKIGNPPGQPGTDVDLVLPPTPDSDAHGEWAPFVILEDKIDSAELAYVIEQ